jgi:hypothetical protein
MSDAGEQRSEDRGQRTDAKNREPQNIDVKRLFDPHK